MADTANPTTGAAGDPMRAAGAMLLDLDAAEEAEAPETEQPEAEAAGTDDAAEAADETADGDDAEAADEAEAGPELPPTLTGLAEAIGVDFDQLKGLKTAVKIDGIEQEVTLGELVQGYSRDADYRQKTQALAEQRRAFDAERQAAQEHQTRGVAQIKTLLDHFDALVAPPQYSQEELDRLYQEDPVAFVRADADNRKARERSSALKAALSAQVQAHEAQQQKALAEMAAAETAKLRAAVALPDEKFTGEMKDVAKYLSERGFSREEISSVIDHRAVLIARDAMLYQRLAAAKDTARAKVATAPKTLKAIATKSRAVQQGEAIAKQKQQLRKTGDATLGARLFLHQTGHR